VLLEADAVVAARALALPFISRTVSTGTDGLRHNHGNDFGAVEKQLETDFFGGGELMVRKPRAPAMSKQAMREESERLVSEAMARNVTVTQGKTQLDVNCSKCGAPNRVDAEGDHGRVEYTCKKCGHKQKTL
jgi:DNA-directed RNA polymerase subunit RPC12/RpoP